MCYIWLFSSLLRLVETRYIRILHVYISIGSWGEDGFVTLVVAIASAKVLMRLRGDGLALNDTGVPRCKLTFSGTRPLFLAVVVLKIGSESLLCWYWFPIGKNLGSAILA